MHAQTFKAGVQYGDWKGTSAADDSDQDRLYDWIEKANLKKEGEFLVGVDMYAGEHKGDVSVKLLFFPLDGFDNVEAKIASTNGPVEVRVVRHDMPLQEFMGLFKRFNIAFSRHGIFEGQEFTEID